MAKAVGIDLGNDEQRHRCYGRRRADRSRQQ